jgi:peptidoglycan L-alanyl-D-glutamate endopeptidase CwlK
MQCVAKFIFDAAVKGYLATAGEAWRSPETCALYAKEGKGILHSLHPERLAIDLNFFYEGKLITTGQQYEPLGRMWEAYSTEEFTCTAGVFFTPHQDSDHFSVSNGGVK